MEVKLRSKMSHWPKISHRYEGDGGGARTTNVSLVPPVLLSIAVTYLIEVHWLLFWYLPNFDDLSKIWECEVTIL